jgi:hypothetical protein
MPLLSGSRIRGRRRVRIGSYQHRAHFIVAHGLAFVRVSPCILALPVRSPSPPFLQPYNTPRDCTSFLCYHTRAHLSLVLEAAIHSAADPSTVLALRAALDARHQLDVTALHLHACGARPSLHHVRVHSSNTQQLACFPTARHVLCCTSVGLAPSIAAWHRTHRRTAQGVCPGCVSALSAAAAACPRKTEMWRRSRLACRSSVLSCVCASSRD